MTKVEKKEYMRLWEIKNKERRDEYREKYREDNRNILKHRCKAWRDINKPREKAYNAKYKAKNREAILLHNRAAKLKLIEYFGDKCLDCSLVFHPNVYEFHHRIPSEKEGTISKMYRLSWEDILYEAAKTDMLCKNCHCMRHVEMNETGDTFK